MIKILKQKKIEFYLLLLILIIGSIFRFYNYPYRYSLGEETIRDAVIGIEGARQLQFPLTGSFSSLGPFTFGPWYAYQLIIFNLLVPFVYSPWIYLSLISVAYIFIMYNIGNMLGGKVFALILALLSAVSPAQIISATHLTSHNNTNIFAVLAIWIFLRLISKNLSYWWGFLLGFVIGIGMNLHFQMAGLLILLFILLVYKRKRYLYFLAGIGGVCVSFLPLIFFEFNNHWFTTKNIIYYVLYGKNAIYVPNRWLFYIRDFWPSFWGDALGIPVWTAQIIILLFSVLAVWFYIKKKIRIEMLLVFMAFVFNFILLRYYWGQKFFGYLNYLRPFVFIFTTFVLISLISVKKNKILNYGTYLILIAIIVMSLPRVLSELDKDSFTMKMYELTSAIENYYPNKKFVIYTCSKLYDSSYNAKAFSIQFLLELKHKVDFKNGIKLGLIRDCAYPRQIDNKAVADLGEFVDFNNESEPSLLKNGWKPISFSYIYDSYARWWFKLQP